jgi:hypothetical protein
MIVGKTAAFYCVFCGAGARLDEYDPNNVMDVCSSSWSAREEEL